jgi:hypothetical protein
VQALRTSEVSCLDVCPFAHLQQQALSPASAHYVCECLQRQDPIADGIFAVYEEAGDVAVSARSCCVL